MCVERVYLAQCLALVEGSCEHGNERPGSSVSEKAQV
jgi:hypothetical protein